MRRCVCTCACLIRAELQLQQIQMEHQVNLSSIEIFAASNIPFLSNIHPCPHNLIVCLNYTITKLDSSGDLALGTISSGGSFWRVNPNFSSMTNWLGSIPLGR